MKGDKISAGQCTPLYCKTHKTAAKEHYEHLWDTDSPTCSFISVLAEGRATLLV